jgi:hypothetical protein
MSGPYGRPRSPEARAPNGPTHAAASAYSRYPPAAGAGPANGSAPRAAWTDGASPTANFFAARSAPGTTAYPPGAANASATDGDRFAYSTTLRRQQTQGAEGFSELIASPTNVLFDEGATGVWHRLRDAFAGPTERHASDAPAGAKQPPGDTASARFAHYSIEVG